VRIAYGETVASHVSGCGPSRAQSGERAQDAVRGRLGLCRVCTGAGAGVCASLRATPGILRHAQPQASRRLAVEGWRPVTMHELTHVDPYARVASASPPGRGRSCVPRALHIVSCRNERISPDGLSRRGAESSAGGPRRTRAAVGLESCRDVRLCPVACVADGASR
jgi:hypothetical protein